MENQPRTQRVDHETECGCGYSNAQRNHGEQSKKREERNGVTRASQQDLASRDDVTKDSGNTPDPEVGDRISFRHTACTKYVATGAREHRQEHDRPLHQSTLPGCGLVATGVRATRNTPKQISRTPIHRIN